MKINELSKKAHDISVEKGFYEQDRAITEMLMLIITEIAEACEADRNKNFEGFKEEIADAFIRLGDMCGYLGIDIEYEITKKMEKNKKRPYKHGKEY